MQPPLQRVQPRSRIYAYEFRATCKTSLSHAYLSLTRLPAEQTQIWRVIKKRRDRIMEARLYILKDTSVFK